MNMHYNFGLKIKIKYFAKRNKKKICELLQRAAITNKRKKDENFSNREGNKQTIFHI